MWDWLILAPFALGLVLALAGVDLTDPKFFDDTTE